MADTDALSEAELAGLVTRDSMIGVGPAASPGEHAFNEPWEIRAFAMAVAVAVDPPVR